MTSGCLEVFLQQQRGDRKNVTDVVEPFADIVGREALGRFEVNRQKIPKRVVVLDTVQSADCRLARGKWARAVDVVHRARQPTGDLHSLVVRGLVGIVGRHSFRLDLADHFRPSRSIEDEVGRLGELIKGDSPLRLIRRMTIHAVLRDEGANVRFEQAFVEAGPPSNRSPQEAGEQKLSTNSRHPSLLVGFTGSCPLAGSDHLKYHSPQNQVSAPPQVIIISTVMVDAFEP